jgi:hypothetical protein
MSFKALHPSPFTFHPSPFYSCNAFIFKPVWQRFVSVRCTFFILMNRYFYKNFGALHLQSSMPMMHVQFVESRILESLNL